MTSNLFYENKNVCNDVSLNDSAFFNNLIIDDEPKEIKIVEPPQEKINFINDEQNQTSSLSNEISTSLSSWGLPENILSKYEDRGIKNMFKWQAECLSNQKILSQNSNLVYSAPTSAGKTLVAEILALKTVLEKQKKVIIILPFVSVVREKMFYFQDILASSGIRVEGFMGSHSPPGGFKSVQFAVCTIEKANSIVNRLLAEGALSDLGAVIIDEMHLLGDASRGYILELLLTKLRYMSAKDDDVNIQLIGMSATLPNLELLSKWLNAELYTTDFRPIPLYEFSLVCGEIYDTKFKLQRRLKKIPELVEDSDNILQLCLETISMSCSVLIFCPTKNWCENLAQQISVAFRKLGMSDSKFGKCLREQLSSDAIIEILEQLHRSPVGLDSVLKKTVSFGVAFHHAGLTMDERDIIEGAFRNGGLRVLVATSTLSSGVNLPAQRVIIRTPLFHGKPIDPLTYRQMIGRAGRMGRDSSGESFLICQKNDKRIATELMSAKLRPIESCLEGAGKLKRAILEVIASGVATTPEDINTFTRCTLLSSCVEENTEIANPIEEAVRFLINNEFIRLQKDEKSGLQYVPTALAKACLSSSLPPEDGLILFEEIEKARQCFVLDTDLHLLYLVTPYSVCIQWTNLDWMSYLNIWEKLPANMKRVAELVGVRESYIFNATLGKINTSTAKFYHKLQIHRRFYTALALQDLVNEVPLINVASKFQCSRGMLQSLQQSASMFAGMVTSFCNQLKWKCVEILVSQFQDRLQFGIQHELLDLMKLSVLNGPRARALYNSGIETLTDLASFDVCKLENILHASVPFQSEKERDGETAYDLEEKKKMRSIWITGKQGLTAREAAEMLIKDARKYLQLEMGAASVKWDSTGNDSSTSYTTGSSYTSSSGGKTCKYFSTSSTDSEQEINNFNNNKIVINNNNHLKDGNTFSTIKRDIESDVKMTTLINKFSQHSLISSNDSVNEISKSKNITNLNNLNNIMDEQNNSLIQNPKPSSLQDINNTIKHGSLNEISDSKNMTSLNNLNNIVDEKNNSLIQNPKPSSLQNLHNTTKHDSVVNNYETNNKDLSKNDIFDDDIFDCNWTLLENEIPSIANTNTNVTSNNSPKSTSTNEHEMHNTSSTILSESENLFEDSLHLNSKLCDALDISSINNKDNNDIQINDTLFFENSFNTVAIDNESVIPTDTNHDNSGIIDTSISEKVNSFCVLRTIKKRKQKMKRLQRKRSRRKDDNSLKELSDNSLTSHETPRKKRKRNSFNNILNKNSLEENIFELSKADMSLSLSPQRKSENIVPVDLSCLDIIPVCKNKRLFETFCKEFVNKETLSLALACELITEKKLIIGENIVKPFLEEDKRSDTVGKPFFVGNKQVTGVAISCGENTVYYISFIDLEYISNNEKINFLQKILNNKNFKLRVFDSKEQIKVLYNACGIAVNCKIEDPKVADWLLEPEGKEKNLQAMALKYSPEAVGISQLAGNSKGVGSIALDVYCCILSHIRASVESIVTWHVMESQKEIVQNENIKFLDTFNTEMSTITCLARMELTGIGVDKNKMNKIIDTLQEQMNSLQKQAFSLAGRRFSFTSSKDVAMVLGLYKGKRVSTNKQTLEQSNNPLSNLIIQWRKLSSTLTKMLFPLIRSLKNDRIHSRCITYSATGRISMHEPNLQNVPRNFDIINPDKTTARLSVRATFVPRQGKVFISADYCQLELRILAHLSQDAVLCNIMRKEGDVFKSIAANLNKLCEKEVTDVLRQRAKQLCYGIIYGMGVKSLSIQMGASEEEAAEFMNTFISTYPCLKQFIQQTISTCKERGYVETLSGRRRYLPNINSDTLTIKGQAERQAVNTIIQGSAADIAKNAMIAVEDNLDKFYISITRTDLKSSFVLHLHDELLYEVPIQDLKTVAVIIKNVMENSVKLSIPFPVKLKSGPSWGELEEFDI